ncbi:hypothetical protein V6N11_039219 [Hibiscus sabdariffa]|uniref:Uncharacterized protein n=1 Tax=Hibiscus sabdariffa TaxID=183260 RepID=A0ABR2SN20_9ROSI
MALLGLASAWPVLWMVDFSVGVEHPGVSNPGVLSLGEFPHLVLGTAETISREAVDGIVAGNMVPGSKAVGEATGDAKSGEGLRDLEKDMKSLFSGQTFSFYPPVENESKIFVQPPREVLDLGAKQWDNALLGNFLGKSPPLGIFQRTTDKLWGREGSVEIRAYSFPSGSRFYRGIDHGSLVSGSIEAVVSGAGLGVELGVVSPQAVRVDGVGEGSSAQLVPGSVPPSFGQTLEDERVDLVSGQDGVSNISANKFEVLCAVVDDQVVKDFLTRPERVVVGGVAELMEKLKPKEKGKVAKKKGKGRGAVKDMGFEGCASPSFG